MNNFEIIDSNGTIHSGSYEEMLLTWELMNYSLETIFEIYNSSYSMEQLRQKKEEIKSNWTGDLKLIEIHAVTR